MSMKEKSVKVKDNHPTDSQFNGLKSLQGRDVARYANSVFKQKLKSIRDKLNHSGFVTKLLVKEIDRAIRDHRVNGYVVSKRDQVLLRRLKEVQKGWGERKTNQSMKM